MTPMMGVLFLHTQSEVESEKIANMLLIKV